MAEKLEFDLTVKNNQLSKALDESAKKSSDLGSALSGALSVFGGNLITKGFDILIGSINDLINVAGESIDAAAGQEVATNNLSNAMLRAGTYSKQAAADMADFAGELQATSIYEDDAVLSSAALLQSLTKLSTDGLKGGVKAAADFATVLGVDLETATRLVAKAADGNTDAFKKYGIEIQKGSTNSETFANAVSKLNQQFGGASASQLQTYSGSLKAVKNAYGDMLEPIGNIIVQNPAVIAAFNGIKDVLNGANKAIGENNEGLKGFIQDGIMLFLSVSQNVFDALDGITIVFKGLINTILLVRNAFILGIIEPVKIAIDAIIAIGSYIPGIGDEVAKLDNILGKTSDTLKNNMAGAFEDLKNSADGNIFRALSDGTEEFATKWSDTTAQIIADNEKGKKSGDDRVSNEDEANAALVEKRKQLGIDLRAIAEVFQAEEKALNEALYNQGIVDEFDRKQAELQSLYDLETAKLEATTNAEIARTKSIADEEEKRLTKKKIYKDAELKQMKLDSQLELAEEANKKAKQKKIDDDNLKDKNAFYSAATSLASSKNKELAAVGKAFAIQQATMEGYQSIQSSYRFGSITGGPILGATFAAIAAAATAANIAKIAGVGFADGGIVGATMGGDNRLASIRDGEMVLNGEDQLTLFNAIKSGSFGGGNIQIIIDGREIAYAVRNQVQGGFRLA